MRMEWFLLGYGCLLPLLLICTFATDTNNVYQPCEDTLIKKNDGFTFGFGFARNESFFSNNIQLSPCDSRLGLSSSVAKLAVFRPKVDEISLLTINSSDFNPSSSMSHMVAFAGRKYAARSIPTFVANDTLIVTKFTLVFEFQKGRLQNLYWKRDGCASCLGKPNFVCLNKQDCAISQEKCKQRGGQTDCSLGMQLTFSGTDKHYAALNSWYEVKNLRQDSLYGLYSSLKNVLTIR